MRRRAFISGLAAATVVTVARAQPARKQPVVGFLGSGAASSSWGSWAAAFVKRLGELGWSDGRNITIEFRWADGRSDRIAEIAAEFVRQNVDVIVTSGLAAPVAKRATSTIPIVFGIAVDPLGTGLVNNLSRPGGNVTGFSLQHVDSAGKRIELLREFLPGLRRMAILSNRNYPASQLEAASVQTVATEHGIQFHSLEIARADEIPVSFVSLADRADALYVCADPLMNTHRVQINQLALAARLPTIHGNREYVETNGLVSYGPEFTDLWRSAAGYVDKILKGARPAALPVQQPTKFELVINLKTAKALDITVPPTLLARADEVIE
jgi:putative tryptophan/tyrosine transport system substrate-binding protein